MKRIIWLFTLIAISLSISAQVLVPNGYRYPTENDIKIGWKYEKKLNHPMPYHIRADYNGDGREDDAWILIKKEGMGWAAYAFMNTVNGRKVILLDSSDKSYAQTMGLRVKQPGTYKTACAKGYGPACRSDEPKEIILKRPGMELFQFESSSSVFYWDDTKNQFQRIWLSD